MATLIVLGDTPSKSFVACVDIENRLTNGNGGFTTIRPGLGDSKKIFKSQVESSCFESINTDGCFKRLNLKVHLSAPAAELQRWCVQQTDFYIFINAMVHDCLCDLLFQLYIIQSV